MRGMEILEIAPAEALRRLQSGAVLVDVRGDHERALGMARGALGVVREQLEAAPGDVVPDPDTEVLLICQRSEEHTSELQSLMRISYAVFCLKKKKNNNKQSILEPQHKT